MNILDIDPGIAEQNACILEHHINNKIFDSLVKFISFVENHPDLLTEYKNYNDQSKDE